MEMPLSESRYPLNYYSLEEFHADSAPLSVALGVFDGVHRGHQMLLAKAVEEAHVFERRVAPAALTFDPHPTLTFSPARVPMMLGTIEERSRLLHQQGAEAVIVAHFDRAFSSQTPEEFVENILVNRLRACSVIVGEDFRFGCDRTGDPTFLRAAGARHGFSVHTIPPVLIEGIPVRSSVIRQMLLGGAVQNAATLLGRPYSLHGTVVHGKQLGRTLGYPTANLASDPTLLIPGAGVYAGRAHTKSGIYRTAISIGTNPTVTTAIDAPRTVEAFLMDGFHDDLYGQEITLEFIAYLRGMEKFDGLEALVAQMAQDVQEAERKVSL